ncbi:MAG TPA: bifunctional (p)ppGpp synthetase/guanosine-3',5'-bis(diphosphate) 3'-pyrophosphohydrolase [Firmicutes bacterium]|nr:bifunctional (p)ppGpp synthetase/guanosine-3',5'-bis(diphosphate) 3'-pyrophosphohydrolase [Candidatus Fermentithermobacillaceae bacterium]
MAVVEIEQDIGQYLSDQDKELVRRAYAFASRAHSGQYRLSGEEFIEHPVAVAKILSELEGDAETLAAALLHDVVEDTPVKLEEIRAEFGEEVAKLVDGVTKLSRIQFHSRVEEQVSNLRKMFLAMAEDWRVLVIRLADRLHNLRTLSALPPEKQKRTAEETLEIYAPLAHRLGIWRFKWELEDLAFRYLEPEEYRSLAKRIAAKRSEREAEAAMVIARLKDKLLSAGIQCEVQGRAKNLYSIYRKMRTQGKDLSEIYDLLAVRVIVNNVTDCYEVLGIAHTLWKPMPGRFKDYIAMPKPNGYQSLHTTVVGPLGEPFEIQIRTREMDRTAEYGSAAHWKYKEGGKTDKAFDQKMAWLRQLLDWQREMTDAGEFMEALKIDVFNDEVFVFTPKGDVVDLPVGSTPLDFAYKIHTDIGHHCVGAKVNGKMVPLDYKLNTGDIVEILTSRQSVGPSRDWLEIVKTPQARSKIRAFFKRQLREEDIARGKTALDKEIQKLGLKMSVLEDSNILSNVLEKLNYPDIQNLYAAIAYGGMSPVHVASRIKDEVLRVKPDLLPHKEEATRTFQRKPRGPEEAVIVKGMKDFLVRLAHCCNPVPGDPIIGYITRGRGVTVHRLDCPTIAAYNDKERFIEVTWERAVQASYPVEILIEGQDRPGLFADVTSVIAGLGANILNASARGQADGTARIDITFEIHNLDELQEATSRIRQIKGISRVNRVFGRVR